MATFQLRSCLALAPAPSRTLSCSSSCCLVPREAAPRPGQELGSSLLLGENTVYLVTLRKERAGIAGDTPCSLQDACCRERVIYFCRGNRRVSGNVADFSVGGVGGTRGPLSALCSPGGSLPEHPKARSVPGATLGHVAEPRHRSAATFPPWASRSVPLYFFLLPFPFPYPTVAAAAAAHLRSAPRDARLGALRRLRRCRGAEWRREGAASEPLVSR